MKTSLDSIKIDGLDSNTVRKRNEIIEAGKMS